MAIGTRRLGRNGPRVSELGFGCTGVWARRWVDEASAVSLVHEALKLGITVFHTDADDGNGLAEKRLGRALATLGPARDRLMVSTRVGTVRLARGERAKDFSPDSVEAQVVTSLDRLGLERLPLLYLDAPDPAHLSDDLLDTLAALKGDGAVGLIGVTGDEHQIMTALNTRMFDVIMPVYNPIHRASDPVIERATRDGLGVMAAAPLVRMAFAPMVSDWTLARGWWTAARRMRDRLGGDRDAARAGAYRFLGTLTDWTPAQASLGFVLTNPAVACAVFATGDRRHLHENVAASGRALPDTALNRIATTP